MTVRFFIAQDCKHYVIIENYNDKRKEGYYAEDFQKKYYNGYDIFGYGYVFD